VSADRDAERIVRSWLEEGVTKLPERVLDAVLDDLPATQQRRFTWWPARRLFHMNKALAFGLAAAAVVIVAILGFRFLVPAGPSIGGPAETPTPTASPAAFHVGTLTAGTYVMTPFTGVGASGLCMPEDSECVEDPADDRIRVTLTVPDGYDAVTNGRPLIFGPDGDTGLIILRGAGLYTDPCHSTPPPDIAVGPTVDDFANAIADHPLLDATTPVDVTLAGFSGKYIDLQLPADVEQCTDATFWPYEPGVYAQGPSHQWHLWILDVNGIRVVIQSMDYPSTSADQQAELQAIVSSIQIEP
jgi:hypothetical protein